jgi:methyl-accepting chemotaxis protein/methyl-accepting chemotaxis protein-1 (serine sensor receptor)
MNRFTISIRIWLLIGIALTAGACSSTFLIFRLKAVTASYEALLDNLQTEAREQDSTRQMQVSFKKEVQAWKDILIRGYDPDKLQKYSDEFRTQAGSVKATAAALKKDVSDSEIRSLIEQFEQAHSDLGEKYDAGLQVFVQSKGLDVKGVDGMVAGQDRSPTDLIDRIVALAVQRTNAQRASLASAVASQISQLTVVMILAFGCIGLLAAFITRKISGALQEAIHELSDGADQVAAAAGQVSSSSQSLAQGSSEQAASLEETSASSEEINSMARKNSENSLGAAELVRLSQEKFQQTNHSLDQMVRAMGEINAQSGKISKIIKVIDEIAFQTNILALNAAVEAARAGEAGMGFAVVADEVRNLAQRCAQAAKDTAEMIEESIARSNGGQSTVDQVAAAIRNITAESAKVKTLVDEVNLGSVEQARGIEQIGRAITQMEQVTQKSAASAEESASAAEELNAQSETMKFVVMRLTDMVGGETKSGRRPITTRNARRREPARALSGRSDTAFHADDDFGDFR